MIRLKQLLHEWTGETWNAYTDWKSHKNDLLTTTILAPEFMSGPAIEVNASNSAFTITYQGPASGVHVAHANVYMCMYMKWTCHVHGHVHVHIKI